MTIAVDTTEFVNNQIDLAREQLSAQIATNPANYVPGNVLAQPSANAWNNYNSATSNPFADITAAQQAIFQQIRKLPNRIIMGEETALYLAQHPLTIDRVKYTHPDQLTAQGLPKTLLGMEVVVAGAGVNTAAYGAPANIADIWARTSSWRTSRTHQRSSLCRSVRHSAPSGMQRSTVRKPVTAIGWKRPIFTML